MMTGGHVRLEFFYYLFFGCVCLGEREGGKSGEEKRERKLERKLVGLCSFLSSLTKFSTRFKENEENGTKKLGGEGFEVKRLLCSPFSTFVIFFFL